VLKTAIYTVIPAQMGVLTKQFPLAAIGSMVT